MRIPVPRNRLVAFTLAGALLTTIVAGGLAFPGLGLAGVQDDGTAPDAPTTQQAGPDAPTPNQNFTPAVQTQSGSGEYEDEAYEDEEYEDEEHEGEDEYGGEEYDDEEHEEEDEYGEREAHEDEDGEEYEE